MRKFLSDIKLIFFISSYLLFPGYAFSQVSTNNWYVGNTEPGEWIRYKRIWLSSGSYRFTMQGVACAENQKVHLEISGQSFKSVVVPIDSKNAFHYIHLGHKELAEGYYDVKLVFDSGNVNCDMLFIRKSSYGSDSFLKSDVEYTINKKQGLKVAPIGAPDFSSGLLIDVGKQHLDDVFYDQKSQRFSQEQVLSWNKQQIYSYTPRFTDQAMDIWVSELVAAKVNFVYMHGRGQNDYVNEVEDRDYIGADGNFDPRYLTKFVAAVNRSPYAKDNIKLAYFQDNVSYADVYKKKTGLTARWGDASFQDFLWNYAFKPWFTYVPGQMLYKREDGRVPVQIWTANMTGYDYEKQGNEIMECLEYIKKKIVSEFNIIPFFVLDKTFFSRDPRTQEYADGIQSWFTWSGSISSINIHKGRQYAFSVNGKRYPLKLTWYNDWNAETGNGTPVLAGRGDYHVSSLLDDGTEAIRPIFQMAESLNADSIVLESWSDWKEGTTFYRSEHPEYLWPNQYIALLREYADRDSESIVLEAEDCDEFFDLSPGNSGGAYRVHWYKGGGQVDLDIYRPLHNLVDKIKVDRPSTALIDFSVGFEDLWGFDLEGGIQCHEVDGIPVNWLPVSNSLKVRDLSLGRYYAWAITRDNKVMKAALPYGWKSNACSSWIDVTDGKPMKDIDLNLKQVWGVNNEGEVFYRDLDGADKWIPISGKLASITADDNFIWGFNDEGELMCCSTFVKSGWKKIPNPYKLIKIEAGGGEVWGVNADQEVYRTNASGEGAWEYVSKGKNVGVGFEFAWLLDDSGIFQRYKLEGFAQESSFKALSNHSNDHSADDIIVNVFPNPSSGNFNVQISGYNGIQVRLKLYDALGRCIIYDTDFKYSQEQVYPLRVDSKLSSGLYFLEVSGDNFKKVAKLIIN